MDPDFVKVKFTIFWRNRGLKVYLDLYAPNFQKNISKYFFGLCTFIVQNNIFCRHFSSIVKNLFCQQYIDLNILEKYE